VIEDGDQTVSSLEAACWIWGDKLAYVCHGSPYSDHTQPIPNGGHILAAGPGSGPSQQCMTSDEAWQPNDVLLLDADRAPPARTRLQQGSFRLQPLFRSWGALRFHFHHPRKPTSRSLPPKSEVLDLNLTPGPAKLIWPGRSSLSTSLYTSLPGVAIPAPSSRQGRGVLLASSPCITFINTRSPKSRNGNTTPPRSWLPSLHALQFRAESLESSSPVSQVASAHVLFSLPIARLVLQAYLFILHSGLPRTTASLREIRLGSMPMLGN
jgi:hypothetical protein